MSKILRPRRLAAAALVALVGLAAAPMGTAVAGAGCSVDCVGPVTTHQSLRDKARVSVDLETTVPANVKVEILAGPVAVATLTELAGSYTKLHHLSSGEVMTQGVRYSMRITATDKAGRSRVENSYITAVSRTVTLKVTKLLVTEDSDWGAGELGAAVKLSGQVGDLFWDRPTTATTSIPMNFTMTVRNVPASARIYSQVVDSDDHVGIYCIWTWQFQTNGGDQCWEWSTGNTRMWTVSETPGTVSGSWDAGAAGRIGFVMSGTYTATVG